jgi:crotonobetainyl-CoA:carnitine CoA-transferase CaiB-like acyl-CoA transferase
MGAEVYQVSVNDAGMTMTVEREGGRVEVVNVFRGLSQDVSLNKERRVLNLKDSDDLDDALKLVDICDVFVTNLRVGVPERLGFGFEAVSARNPRIIYATLLGWGRLGPMSSQAAVDSLVQSFSGWASLTGARGSTGELNRHTSHVDVTAASVLAEAVLLGLIERERTGLGLHVDVSMLDVAVAAQSTRLAEYFATGEIPVPLGSAASTTAPHEAFLCSDGVWLAIGVEREEQWKGLCAAVGMSELVDDRRFWTNELRVQNRPDLSTLLAHRFAAEPATSLEIRLRRSGVPHGRVHGLADWKHHAQAVANSWVVEIEGFAGPLTVEGPPWRFSSTPAVMPRREK